MRRRGSATDYGIEGARNEELLRRLVAVEQRQGDTEAVTVSLPEPDTSFTPIQVRDRNRVLATLAFFIPGDTDELIIVAGYRDELIDATTFDQNTFRTRLEAITDDQRAAGRVEARLNRRLNYNRTVDIIRLIALARNDARLKNPELDPIFSEYPGNVLYSFNTIDAFGVPSSPAANLILRNQLDPITKEYDAEFYLRVYAPLSDTGQAQTWQQAVGTTTTPRVLCIISRVGSTDPARKIHYTLSGVELTQTDAASPGVANRGFVDVPCKPFAPGGLYSWDKNVTWTDGDRKESTGAAVQFRAAGFSNDPALLSNLSVTILSNEPNDAKGVSVELNFRQNATIVALKHATGRIKKTSEADSAYKVFAKKISMRDDEWHVANTLYSTANSPNNALLLSQNVKTKPNNSYRIEIQIATVGGGQRTFTQDFSVGAGGEVELDPGAPTLATPSHPDVEERFGDIFVSCPTPVANVNTLFEFQVIMSLSNLAPVGPPIVGTEGVVKVKRGQFVTFRAKQNQSDDLFFFYRARNASFSLYSGWSSGTLLTPDGVARPLDDFIGDGPAELPMGLRINGTSASGHTSTQFFLDSSASDEDDAYNGMVLHVPSEGTDDRVRIITDYDGALRRCTVAAFSSTPVGAVAYEIHYGQERAAQSGTGHTSTTFILDAGASATNDFYNAKSIYIPALATGDRIRRVLDYNGATKAITVDTFGVTPVGAHGFIMFDGNIGYANYDQTGIATGVPLRLYYDSDTGDNISEVIAPVGENAYSLEYAQVQVVKKGNGKFQADAKIATSLTLEYRHRPPSSGYIPVFRVLFANRFREGGSDGKSAFSYWVEGFQNSGGANTYDPGTFPPVERDYLDDIFRPGNRYSDY